MTERTMSPTAAAAHARVITRQRFKLLRKDPRPVADIKVDSPAVFADRLFAVLQPASKNNPGPYSKAHAEHVQLLAYERFMELCRSTPVRARRA